MTKARILSNAAARYVTGQSSTTRVAEMTRKFDRVFAKGAMIEKAHNGIRIVSLCESVVINCAASDEGRLFRYA